MALPTLKEIREEKKRREKLAKEEAKTGKLRIFALVITLIGLAVIYYDYSQIQSGSFNPIEMSALWAEIKWTGFVAAFFAVMALGDKNPKVIKILIGVPVSAIMMLTAVWAKVLALFTKELPGKLGKIGKLLSKGLVIIGLLFTLYSGAMSMSLALFFGTYFFEKWLRRLLGKFPKAVFPVTYLKKGPPWFWWFFESKPPKTKDQEKLLKSLEEKGLV